MFDKLGTYVHFKLHWISPNYFQLLNMIHLLRRDVLIMYMHFESTKVMIEVMPK